MIVTSVLSTLQDFQARISIQLFTQTWNLHANQFHSSPYQSQFLGHSKSTSSLKWWKIWNLPRKKFIHIIDPNYVLGDELVAPQTFSQGELNDLVRDLDLSKEKAELLASRLKQKKLLDKDVLISHYRKRNLNLAQHFTTDGALC